MSWGAKIYDSAGNALFDIDGSGLFLQGVFYEETHDTVTSNTMAGSTAKAFTEISEYPTVETVIAPNWAWPTIVRCKKYIINNGSQAISYPATSNIHIKNASVPDYPTYTIRPYIYTKPTNIVLTIRRGAASTGSGIAFFGTDGHVALSDTSVPYIRVATGTATTVQLSSYNEIQNTEAEYAGTQNITFQTPLTYRPFIVLTSSSDYVAFHSMFTANGKYVGACVIGYKTVGSTTSLSEVNTSFNYEIYAHPSDVAMTLSNNGVALYTETGQLAFASSDAPPFIVKEHQFLHAYHSVQTPTLAYSSGIFSYYNCHASEPNPQSISGVNRVLLNNMDSYAGAFTRFTSEATYSPDARFAYYTVAGNFVKLANGVLSYQRKASASFMTVGHSQYVRDYCSMSFGASQPVSVYYN